jgi:hypothetical protein
MQGIKDRPDKLRRGLVARFSNLNNPPRFPAPSQPADARNFTDSLVQRRYLATANNCPQNQLFACTPPGNFLTAKNTVLFIPDVGNCPARINSAN